MADRYTIEQVSLGRYDVYGPNGRVIESHGDYNAAYNHVQHLLGYDQGSSPSIWSIAGKTDAPMGARLKRLSFSC